jgi:hypothetical protein
MLGWMDNWEMLWVDTGMHTRAWLLTGKTRHLTQQLQQQQRDHHQGLQQTKQQQDLRQ